MRGDNPIIIDIGSEALIRNHNTLSLGGNTFLDKTNPANASGKIKTIQIYGQNQLSNCEVATFYLVSGNNFSTRDHAFIGTVPGWGLHEFPVNIDVEEGDFIGIYYTAGYFRMSTQTEGQGIYYRAGDKIPVTNETFTYYGKYQISLHGIGETEPVFKDSARTGIYSLKTLK